MEYDQVQAIALILSYYVRYDIVDIVSESVDVDFFFKFFFLSIAL